MSRTVSPDALRRSTATRRSSSDARCAASSASTRPARACSMSSAASLPRTGSHRDVEAVGATSSPSARSGVARHRLDVCKSSRLRIDAAKIRDADPPPRTVPLGDRPVRRPHASHHLVPRIRLVYQVGHDPPGRLLADLAVARDCHAARSALPDGRVPPLANESPLRLAWRAAAPIRRVIPARFTDRCLHRGDVSKSTGIDSRAGVRDSARCLPDCEQRERPRLFEPGLRHERNTLSAAIWSEMPAG